MSFPLIGLLLYAHSLIIDKLLFYLLLPFTLFASFVIFIITRGVFAFLVVKYYGLPKEGIFDYDSKEADKWKAVIYYMITLKHIGKMLGIPEVSLVWLYRKNLKSKIGDFKVFNDGTVSDPSLVEIGTNCTIGLNAMITGHLIEGDKIFIKKVKIGKNCTIGAHSIISPGVVIGDNTIVGANSFVPKNAKLDANSVYVGSPARKIKSLPKKKS